MIRNVYAYMGNQTLNSYHKCITEYTEHALHHKGYSQLVTTYHQHNNHSATLQEICCNARSVKFK